MSRGNTQGSEAWAAVDLSYSVKRYDCELKGSANYGSSRRKMSAQRYYGLARLAWNFGRDLRWFNFYNLDEEHDHFASIASRLTPATGVGFRLADSERWKARTELGLGSEWTRFSNDTPSRADLVLVSSTFLQRTLLKGVKISEEFGAWPKLSDFGEFRLRTETRLSAPLVEHISLRISFADEYLSDPAPGARQNDLRVTSSIVYWY